jgi:metal-responsive CopG/Arc/MetJ family transcriptional regulator
MHMEESKIARITITIPRDVLLRLDTYAAEHRWSRSTAAAAIIEEAMPDQDEDQGKDQETRSR